MELLAFYLSNLAGGWIEFLLTIALATPVWLAYAEVAERCETRKNS